MTEFIVKNYDGQLYIKEELKKILNSNPLRALANAKTVVMFPVDTSLEAVEQSLNVLLLDVKLRRQFEKEKEVLTEQNGNNE